MNRQGRPNSGRPPAEPGYERRDRRPPSSYDEYQRYATGEFDSVVVPYDDEVMVPPQKKKVFKKVVWSAVGVLGLLLAVAFFLVYNLINSITYEKPDPDVYQPGVNTKASSAARGIPLENSSSVTNILLIGSDAGQNSRSDTMLLLSIDRKNKKLKMTSFLRDLYVEVPEHGLARINTAFNHGGPDRVIQTIESNFRVKIDAYFCIDFAGMCDLVNKVGGIECTLTKAEAKYIQNKTGTPTKAGTSRLYGFQSLWYCRIRKLDSDFGRTSRQRNFINFMIADFKTRSLTGQYSFAADMMPYITAREDTKGKMFGYLISAMMATDYETEELSIPVKNGYQGKKISGADVLVPDIEKNCTAIKDFIYGDE